MPTRPCGVLNSAPVAGGLGGVPLRRIFWAAPPAWPPEPTYQRHTGQCAVRPRAWLQPTQSSPGCIAALWSSLCVVQDRRAGLLGALGGPYWYWPAATGHAPQQHARGRQGREGQTETFAWKSTAGADTMSGTEVAVVNRDWVGGRERVAGRGKRETQKDQCQRTSSPQSQCHPCCPPVQM